MRNDHPEKAIYYSCLSVGSIIYEAAGGAALNSIVKEKKKVELFNILCRGSHLSSFLFFLSHESWSCVRKHKLIYKVKCPAASAKNLRTLIKGLSALTFFIWHESY